MIRAFLSHSSKDKNRYVKIVADNLGRDKCVYDGYTFEFGMKTIDEIETHLSTSNLFVVFLSNSALDSKWVRDELNQAKNLVSNGKMKQIFPIIIDKTITYDDNRIPQWLRDEYNIKYVARPTVAARRIEERLRVIVFDKHPRIAKKYHIFVGRNKQMEQLEERLDDHSIDLPNCIVASGLTGIGRKTFIKEGLAKTSITRPTYAPPTIVLDTFESVEDFILKVNDLGFSDIILPSNLFEKELNEKVNIAKKLIQDVSSAKEILFINDNRCIVQGDGELVDWFYGCISCTEYIDRPCIVLASLFPVFEHLYRDNKLIYGIKLFELTHKERRRLLKKYLDVYSISINNDDFDIFANVLTGLPDQAAFAVELIKELTVEGAKKNLKFIINFNSDRIELMIASVIADTLRQDVLALLCKFDFISYKLLLEITCNDDAVSNIIDEFIRYSFCELIGASGEYIRVNDIVRSYVLRTRVEIPSKYKEALHGHVEKFIHDQENQLDISDYLFSLKELLLQNKKLSSEHLIPSVFLKAMKEIYDMRGNMSDVVSLADRVLQNSRYLDKAIITEIRSYLCLALARKRDSRCLREVQNITGPEHNFICGFYYNQIGQYKKAIERLELAIKERPGFFRAQHQMVLTYIAIEEYEKAEGLARKLYETNQQNAFSIVSFLNCLLHKSHHKTDDKHTIEVLLEKLDSYQYPRAKEMQLSSKALYYAFWMNDKDGAIETISEAISLFPKVGYPVINKFKIAFHFKDASCMRATIDHLERLGFDNTFSYLHAKCLYLASTSKPDIAEALLERTSNNFPQYSVNKLRDQIRSIQPVI